jgi:hypothetical protein
LINGKISYFLLADTRDLGGWRGTSIADARTTAVRVAELHDLLQLVFRDVPESFLIEDELFHFGYVSSHKL